MMRRYSFLLASTKIGASSVDTYLVIRTEEVPDHEVRAKGFKPIDTALSDTEVMARFHVETIRTVVHGALPVM